jgi:hypothetical protein
MHVGGATKLVRFQSEHSKQLFLSCFSLSGRTWFVPLSGKVINIIVIPYNLILLQIFGAFCATYWGDRLLRENLDGRFFGLGQTFVFSIYPQRAKYNWVGMAKEEGVPVNQHDIPASGSMFQSGDNSNLMIGGGG